MALAYISGNVEKIHKRSMLTAEEGFISFEIKTEYDFRGASFVWSILRRLLPENIHTKVKSMRIFADMKGAVFDVPEDLVEQVEDCYQKALVHKSVRGYTLDQAKELPELLETDQRGRGNGYGGNSYGDRNGGYGGRGGYGGGRGGFDRGGDRNGGRRDNGYADRGGRSNGGGFDRSNSVFIGGLSYQADQRDLEDFCHKNNLRYTRVKILEDDQRRSKGVAFIDFADAEDANAACKLTGTRVRDRAIKIEPANRS